MSKASSRGALSAFTVATACVCVLLTVSPVAATPNPPSKIGEEVVINTYADHWQRYPAVARLPDMKWVVVWDGDRKDSSSFGVFMQMYNADRTKYEEEVQVNSNFVNNQMNPKVAAAADSSFVVTWYSMHTGIQQNVQSQRFSSTGAKLGEEFTINTGSGHAEFPDVAYLTNGDVVYCWRDASSGTRRTMLRRYDANFNPLGAPIAVSTSPSNTVQDQPPILLWEAS